MSLSSPCPTYQAFASLRRRPLHNARVIRAGCVSCSAARHEVLWLKRDLRTTDHPGLHRLLRKPEDVSSADSSSTSTSTKSALFVFDPHVYKSVVDSPEAAASLASALESLGERLRAIGVSLDVRRGQWEEVLPAYVRDVTRGSSLSNSSEVWTTRVVYERECERAFVAGTRAVAAALDDAGFAVDMEPWDCLLFDGYDEDVEAFPVWERQRVQARKATAPLGDVVADGAQGVGGGSLADQATCLTGEAIWSSIEAIQTKTCVHTDEASQVALFASSSEAHARDILKAYLRAPSTIPDMLLTALMSCDVDEQTIDGCYPAVFNRAINATGSLSRRQVHDEALRYLVENGDTAPYDEEPLFRGPLSWLGWILTSSGGALVRQKKFRRAKAALRGSIQQDFHLGHSYRRDGMQHAYGATTSHWRWRGVLTDYVSVEATERRDERGGSAMSGTRPAIVLVHGFGAFGEHWRRNIKELADMGYDVFAPTFPGYGRSEKMSMQYGQDLWRDFLADFISDIVERPVVIAGNSIGGYISASVAADFPHLIKGLVLLNSAGQINEDFEPRQYERELVESPRQPPPVVVVDAISTLLFSFLQGDVEKQLQRLYPTRPDYADEWLGREIRRASQDPKALGVFRSVFFLPSPRPLNYLINELYRGKVLVLQGALDPLNDAVKRAEQIVAACPQTELQMLQAGHCPHDEVPLEVNRGIADFAKSCFS